LRCEQRILWRSLFRPNFTNRDQRGRTEQSKKERSSRRDLAEFWPREEIPNSYMTHHANFALPKQGYTHCGQMVTRRQLLLLSELLRAIFAARSLKCAISAWRVQQYLRNQNMFCNTTWAMTVRPSLGTPNYATKARFLSKKRRFRPWARNLTSIIETVVDGCGGARSMEVARQATAQKRVKLG